MVKNKKQFGVWLDSEQAILAGRENTEAGTFVILAHINGSGRESNSNENAANNAEISRMHKLFKGITGHMQNVDEIHVTGTGTAQEQFISYLSSTAQYKNAVAKKSTSNKMSDDKFLEMIAAEFN